MAFSFSKALRLKKAADFKHVFQIADRLSVGGISVYFNANELAYPRLGIIIAKRNVRTAVQRNRLKRIVREGFRLNQDTLSGYDFVVIVHKGMDKRTNEDVWSRINRIWKKIEKLAEK